MIISKNHILNLSFNFKLDDIYSFKEVSTSSPPLETPIDSILGNTTPEMFRSMHFISLIPKVGYYDLKEVFVTYDGCIFKDKIFAPLGSNVGDHTKVILDCFLENELTVRTLNHELVCVLYGAGWPTWGHWLVDFLPRIFVLELAGINIKDVFWILPSDVPNYVYFFLEHIGLPLDKIILFNHKQEVLSLKRVLMVPNLVLGMNVHPLMKDYIKWIKSKFQNFQSINERQKIFISRRYVESNRILENRDIVEDIIQSFGYKLFFPESKTIEEQIATFSSATHIIGEYGSGLHSSIFAPSNIVVTCLRAGVKSVGFLQTSLTYAANQKISYVFGKTDIDSERFTIDIDDLKLALEFAEVYGK